MASSNVEVSMTAQISTLGGIFSSPTDKESKYFDQCWYGICSSIMHLHDLMEGEKGIYGTSKSHTRFIVSQVNGFR